MLNPNDRFSQYNQNNFKSPYPQPDLSTPNSQYPPSTRKKRKGCLGCLLIFFIFFIFCAVLSIFSGEITAIKSHPLPIFFQGDFPFGGIGVAVLVGAVFTFLFVMIKVMRGRPQSKWAGVLVLLVFVAVGSGSLWAIFTNPNIGMTRTGFIRTSTVDINTGDAVYFRNPTNGVMQILCVGRDQHCQLGNNDPSQLKNGLVIQPGQTVSVVFNTEGMYQITSKTTPHMNITISVSVPTVDPPTQ